ncbi:hypothetical protein [Planococcus shixiaomingii]|uniref:hypothetical protein n=1 Tax=Planococcus shixiaomingii TaxID=3058393 RepID=UPI00260EFDDC|nr:hypothetical protein [Planococcus sp. N022]WKA56817.1 hypothetical protein QWY21_19550 [Planococcus sp. N022]
MLQAAMLDKLIKILPRGHRLYELLKYDEFWHRFDGKITENHDKTLCGEIFKSLVGDGVDVDDATYKCDDIREFKDLEICPTCLKTWYETETTKFERNLFIGELEISFSEPNKDFLGLLIEKEGYDKVNDLINGLLYRHLQESDLVDKLQEKVDHRIN